MLSQDLRKLLIAQIGNELAAHQLYMAISVYFQRESLGAAFRLIHVADILAVTAGT